ncbi:MAG TPA: single-stranded-DNA-specific exonuclease RecJ [Candidatus Saccharicenans sp.]|jgi:single-stranded-DNA-specific exonuclease|nr:single-stranded-DNA-specific exonuclease RecJ [Candidatus Saccharicenans sp.]
MEANYRWQIRPENPEAWVLAQELNLPNEIAAILVNRGIKKSEEAASFLYGRLPDLHNPFLMRGMKEAVNRIWQAIARKERIVVFGDYDVDGMLSVVMLVKGLRSLGGQVDYFIPDRMKDGYGLKIHHLPHILEMKANLLISVDCGIKATDFVEEGKKNGLEVIITDHHHPGDELPGAVAVLNPVVESSGYPDKNLAGVGVAFKLIQALFLERGTSQDLTPFLKLASIGTVADVASLQGENRILVREGLNRLKEVKTPGLKSLLDISGITTRTVNEVDLGFRLGPRINAAGRLGETELALQLFFSDSEEECAELVKKLNQLNNTRQRIEEKILKEAVEKIKSKKLDERYRLLVLGSENWHRGVIGIVASKIKELFYRPVILFAYENGRAYGSGRSLPDLSLIDLINECSSLLVNFGGHEQAIGCTLNQSELLPFKEKINRLAAEMITDDLLQKKLLIDGRLNFSAITPSFLEFYSRLLPFGVGNRRPVFVAEAVDVLGEPVILKNRHLKFWARQGGRVLEVMAWDKAGLRTELKRGEMLDLVYSLQVSDYRGKSQVHLNVEDARTHLM